MKSFTKHSIGLLMAFLCLGMGAMAQTKITGTIIDATTNEVLAGVNIAIKGTVSGTTADAKGNFVLNTTVKPPFQLAISFVGYETFIKDIKGNESNIKISLKEQAIMGQEVVIAGSRVEETVLKSSTSIEKMDIRTIQQSAAPTFYDALVNMKGVESSQQSLTFRSINTRGFNSNGNVRMVQLIDGMDSQAPGLNFSVGNVAGISELDVESVELLPGASSALYGPNAINGILLMNSKSPFLYKGLSAQYKVGAMHLDDPNGVKASPYSDFAIRWAKSWNDRFAVKVNFAYLNANDWAAGDARNTNANLDPNSTRDTDPNYNGVNLFGDETSTNIRDVANSMVRAGVLPAAAVGLVPNINVSRTGYKESELADYTTKSLRTNLSLHYRITDKIEAVLQGNLGFGTTVYTGADRYSIKNFNIGQYKAEIKGDNFYVRAYTTQERSGDSYANGTTGQLINEGWGGGSGIWFPTYVGAYVQGRSGGLADAAAHIAARAFADKSRPVPGSSEFNTIKDKATATAIPNGSKFVDKTNLYQMEGMYNFKNQIKFAEFLVGGHFRRYELKSDGSIFADKDGRKINIDEWGTYLQGAKQFGDIFKLTASIRYDKNPYFDGQWTPRVSGVFTVAKDHNFRVSYQSAFRIPTTQDQYIDLKVPQARLVGGLPEFAQTYNFTGNPIYTLANLTAYGTEVLRIANLPATQTTAVSLITAYVRNLVTPQVTTGVTNTLRPLVTAGVAAQVELAVKAGQVPNTPAAIQAAIDAGVATALPLEIAKVLPSEIDKAVAANAPKAIADNAANVVQALAVDGANKANILKPYVQRKWNPEKVKSFEIGYKSMINKRLFVDAYWYYNEYTNFSSGVTVAQVNESAKAGLNAQAAQIAGLAGPAYANVNLIPAGLLSGQTRQIYQFPGSSDGKTISTGWALGLDYSLTKGYNISGNVSYNNLKEFDPNIAAEGGRSFFNTPNYRYNLAFNKRPTGNSLGFNVTWRMQDAFVWQTSFVSTPNVNATIVPSFATVDAQVSKKLKSMKSIMKIGASNLFNKYYITSIGNPQIGGIYYVSLSFDELFN